MVPSGDVTFDREIVRHRREASFGVRSQGALRSHAEALIRGRESAPERHDGDVPFMRANGLNRHRTWELGSRGSPPCVSARVGCTWRSKLPAASDPMLVVPRERRRTSEIGLDRARLLEPNLHHAERRGGSAPRRTKRRGTGTERFLSRGCIGRDRSKRMRLTAHHLPVLRRANGGAHEEPSPGLRMCLADADDASRGRLEVGL